MIYSLCDTIPQWPKTREQRCGKRHTLHMVEFRVWTSIIPGMIPIARKSHKDQFHMIVGVHFVTISPLPSLRKHPFVLALRR